MKSSFNLTPHRREPERESDDDDVLIEPRNGERAKNLRAWRQRRYLPIPAADFEECARGDYQFLVAVVFGSRYTAVSWESTRSVASDCFALQLRAHKKRERYGC